MNDSELQSGDSSAISTPKSYRAAALVAFLVCFSWLVMVFSGVFDRLALPSQAQIPTASLIPILAAVAILYRSSLFRENRHWVRLVRLILFGTALFLSAVALLAAVTLILFAVG